MKELPIKFQMRAYGFPGFTHTVKMNGWGDYEVTWARGFDRLSHSMGGSLPNKVFDVEKVKQFVRNCEWFVIDDKPKQEEVSTKLPDVFCFDTPCGTGYKATKRDGYYQVTWRGDDEGTTYGLTMVADCVKQGIWKIIDKEPLTPEQQRALKDFKEQVAQLEQSIKLNQQDICHKDRLVANYEQRKSDVLGKIAELEGK